MQIEHDSNRGDVALQTVAGPAFFRIADVIRITALSRATVYRRIADGKFPPPVHLGGAPVDGHVQRFSSGSLIQTATRVRPSHSCTE